MYCFMYAAVWETSFSSNGKEEIIINCYAPGCVSLESIYFTAYKTLAFVDVRRIFRADLYVFALLLSSPKQVFL